MNDIFNLNFQSGNIIFYILFGLLSISISWWSYSNVVPRVSSFKKYLLLSLRSIGIFLIGILLLEPLITVFSEKTIGSKLGVIVDISSSMTIKEENGQRWQIAETEIEKHLSRNIPISFYGFSDTLIELKDFPDSAMFNGQATDIANAVNSPLADNDDYGGLLIITDGAGNIGLNPLQAASIIDMPVYSLVAGSGISLKDVYISDVEYPAVEYINTEFAIDVEIGAVGYQGQSGQLEIRDGKRAIGSKKITFPPDGAYTSAEFKLSFTDDGVKNLKAVLSGFDDETYNDNNYRNFSIKLLKDKINVLILSSTLNWEFTYLKKALENDWRLNIVTAIANRSGGFKTNDLPANLDAWKKFECVIALDLNSRTLGLQHNNLIAAVEAGTGFLYLSGDKSRFSNLGGWDNILPVKSGSKSAIEYGEFFPVPGQQPAARSVVNIEGLNWEGLPPLKAVISNINLKNDALIFLDMATGRGQRLPVLFGGRHQRGKTAVITGYPWWPRYFRPNSNQVEINHIEKFWGNLVRWLVVRDDLEKFNLRPDKTVYKLGEPVNFIATVFDENYNLVSGARIEVVITDTDGAQRELQLTGKKPGCYEGNFGSPAAGEYDYKAYTVMDGDTTASAKGSFFIESFSLESENTSANYALMEQIASITGGKSYTVDNFDNFNKDLKLKTKKSEVFKEYRFAGNTYLLIIIILLFTLEWGIRKFSQLA